MMHVGIIVLYSYCIVTLPDADVADETSGFISSRERGEGWINGNRHKHRNINKLQPLGCYHPPTPLLCICLHLH